MTTIKKIEVHDIRVPTSDKLLGSDPFHKKPNYSCVYTKIILNNGIEGLSICFTSGAGNDWIAYGVRDISKILKDYDLEEFMQAPIRVYKLINDHHQLRWLADGVNRMAMGCIVNALWDAWAKIKNKPLWKLLVDLSPEEVISSIDWRYLNDAITKEEAKEILINQSNKHHKLEKEILLKGPKAYSTSGWIGLSDQEIKERIDNMKNLGFDCYKVKVGQDLENDISRLSLIRDLIGNEANLMLDCNQVWGVDEAIRYMKELIKFKPIWIEEPTARDDVAGMLKISKFLEKHGIKVACGEQVPSVVIFKQLLQQRAIGFCQIDASRLGGVNDVLGVILLAKKYGIPICPHGGGIGLCNMIIHYAVWDQVKVSSHSSSQFVEYIDFLQEGVFERPVRIENGHYKIPTHPGWGIEMKKSFFDQHLYPNGNIWKGREKSGSIEFLA